MINKIKTLYAIYKNGIHLGNERGKDVDDAIKNYIIAALFEELLEDLDFVAHYSGKVAISGVHFVSQSNNHIK